MACAPPSRRTQSKVKPGVEWGTGARTPPRLAGMEGSEMMRKEDAMVVAAAAESQGCLAAIERSLGVFENLPESHDLSNLPLLQLVSRKHSSLVFLVRLPGEAATAAPSPPNALLYGGLVVVKLFCITRSGSSAKPEPPSNGSKAGNTTTTTQNRIDLLIEEFNSQLPEGINSSACASFMRELVCLTLLEKDAADRRRVAAAAGGAKNTPSAATSSSSIFLQRKIRTPFVHEKGGDGGEEDLSSSTTSFEMQSSDCKNGQECPTTSPPLAASPLFADLVSQVRNNANRYSDTFGPVSIFGWGFAESYRGVILEALNGPCLAEYLAGKHKAPVTGGPPALVPQSHQQLCYRLEWAYQICATVARLHEMGVCHGDIRPDNFGFRVQPSKTTFGALAIFDFGESHLGAHMSERAEAAGEERLLSGAALLSKSGRLEYRRGVASAIQTAIHGKLSAGDEEPDLGLVSATTATSSKSLRDDEFELVPPVCHHWPSEPPARLEAYHQQATPRGGSPRSGLTPQSPTQRNLFDSRPDPAATRSRPSPEASDIHGLGLTLASLFELNRDSKVESCHSCGSVIGLSEDSLWGWYEAGLAALDFACCYVMGAPCSFSSFPSVRVAAGLCSSAEKLRAGLVEETSGAARPRHPMWTMEEFARCRSRWCSAAQAAIRGMVGIVERCTAPDPALRPSAREVTAAALHLLKQVRAFYETFRHIPGLTPHDLPHTYHPAAWEVDQAAGARAAPTIAATTDTAAAGLSSVVGRRGESTPSAARVERGALRAPPQLAYEVYGEGDCAAAVKPRAAAVCSTAAASPVSTPMTTTSSQATVPSARPIPPLHAGMLE